MKFLDQSGRPFDTQCFDGGCVAQAEVRSQRSLTKGGPRTDFTQLPERLAPDRRLHSHFRADGLPIRDRARQSDFEPVVRIAIVAVKQVGELNENGSGDEQIQEPVLIVIGPRTKGRGGSGVIRRAAAAHARETPVAVVVMDGVGLARVQPMHDKQVKMPVIIEISPHVSVIVRSVRSDPGLAGVHLGKRAISEVAEQPIRSRERSVAGYVHIQKPVPIVVCPRRTLRIVLTIGGVLGTIGPTSRCVIFRKEPWPSLRKNMIPPSKL